MKQYSNYKKSGVKYLEKIPAGWGIFKFKVVSTINAQVLPEKTQDNLILKYIDIGNVVTGKLISEPEELRFANAPSRARRIVKKGDVLISTVRTYLKAITFILMFR
ncbi:MAG: hypothetical protein AB8G86_03640 [Saprospiraceae bacterium]